MINVIGSRAHTSTIYDVKNLKKTSFSQTDYSSIYLPQGTINVSVTYTLKKNKEGIYNPSSGTYINSITSGSGDFLGCKGYWVSIVNDKTLISENLAYFDK